MALATGVMQHQARVPPSRKTVRDAEGALRPDGKHRDPGRDDTENQFEERKMTA